MGCIHSKENNTAPRDPPHIFNSRYEECPDSKLGEGAYAVVKKMKSKIDGGIRAVKIVNRASLTKEDDDGIKQEVNILRGLEHPHIVRCYDFFEEPSSYYIVMELVVGGELFDRIVQKTTYNEKEARDTVRTILTAVKYCHDRNIVHRDLKPENLLLASADNNADIKLADFGFAAVVHGEDQTAQCGTPSYVAPEIIEGKNYGLTVDMWSIGVIAFILISGGPPFYSSHTNQKQNQRELFKLIRAGKYEFHDEYWGKISENAKSLIRGLLTVDTSKRLTAKAALEHPWIAVDDAELAKRDLGDNLKHLKKFNATRKFRSAVYAVQTINRFNNLIKNKDNDDNENEASSSI